MRASDSVWTRSLWNVVLAVAAMGLAASNGAAATVNLVAAPVTKAVTLPNGTTVSVPMWGYALDTGNLNTTCALEAGETVTVPGPRITVPPGDSTLTINLKNCLPETTSVVIPGQPFTASPVRAGLRATSMTPEAAASGGTATYVFNGLKPGTFLYQSGSHPAVQVQMGLYGAMTQDTVSAGTAYTDVAYQHEAVLVYSEIDQALHEAVNAGTYGTDAGPTSTVDYRPSLFLINGQSYTTDAVATIPAGTANEVTLLRILNAGLRTHAPVLDNGRLSIVAEDGNKLPYAKDQAAVLLAAGKTHDAVWTPPATGLYSLYDRMLSLNAPGQGSAGMLAKLSVGATNAPASSVSANNDNFSTGQGVALVVAPTGVLSNDTGGPTAAAVVSSPTHGTISAWPGDGGFTYTPDAGFYGVDSFTYVASLESNISQPATVGIAVQQAQLPPTALAQLVGVNATENVAITLAGSDPNGDPLSFYLKALPTRTDGSSTPQGELSYIDPVSKIETPLTNADLRTDPGTGKAIPSGVVLYRPGSGYVGDASFDFVASDGASDSSSAAVTATIYAAENPVTAGLTVPVALTVQGADGVAIESYRWTLEEDLTVKIIPGVPDPNTLAVTFHKSYMPVVAAGDQSAGPMVNPDPRPCPTQADPLATCPRRYFISVLPTENPNALIPAKNYSNGGAELEAGQTAVTVTVSKLPLPTARIRVRVFQDNAPLNGVWDTDEPGLAGFHVTIDDAGGTYGMSGGHQSTDAFGNKLGTTYVPCTTPSCDPTEVASLGDGFVLTDADGYAVIDNLVMGKYTVKVRAPGGQRWIQTSTIEGTPGIDAWVKPNEPQFFTEFGPPGPHVEVGFTRLVNTLTTSGGFTISGRVTNLRQSRPAAVAQFSGAPFTHTRPWVALNSGATGGNLLYAQPTNPDGTFSIAHVPSGSYQLMVFDSALDLIIGSTVVNVAGADKPVGDVAVFNWFTTLYSFVFEDRNGDGIRQDGEPGIPDQALNIRFRDGSIYQSLSTDDRGFKAFNEVFPFFAWMVAEVDYARHHSTGLTVVVDDGGDATAPHPCPGGVGTCGSNAYDWQAQAGLPAGLIPPEVLNPQLQPDNGGLPFRTESGAETPFLLLEGFQGFIGQSTVMMWGKKPYEKPDSFTEDVNVAPFDDFPNVAGGDVDANGDGFFNTDRSNGGIAGIIHYGITRAENDPRWAAAENWEPGVSDVRVQLWDANRTHLLNEVTTDNWNNSVPEGCQWGPTAQTQQPFVYQGQATDCFDGLRNFNQARPALFDGGYAFSTILQDSVNSPTYNLPIDQRGVARPLPAGKYVVKIIVPPGYKLQKEEDKNVDFGDTYVPQQFWLTGYNLADAGGLTEAQPAPTVQDNALIAPFCVGQLHLVPDTLSLFPNQVAGAYAGEMRPLCDAKLVNLRPGQQVAPDFHLFTEAPVAGHVYGMVLDDTTNEFDPNSPTFGEKYAPPFIGVSIRDWQGREITRTYTDQYGMYNALVPSSYTANPPEPSGVSPQLLAACINPPTMPGPGGTVVPDPHFQKQYSHFCYPLQYLAGKTTYLDTPVLPTGAFTGNGTFPVDAELPTQTPVVASVTGQVPGAPGPYIVDNGPGAANDASRTIVIASAASLTTNGLTEVPNPAFGTPGEPKLVTRDYGFGASGTVRLGGQDIPAGNVTWDNRQLTVIVPSGLRTGELEVVRGSGATARKSTLGITLSVATPQMHAARPPKVVANGQKIQPVIDSATPGDLILVGPGTYEEMVVMTKPVRLQGVGAVSTVVNVVTTPAENIQNWLDKMGNLLLSTPAYLLPNQPAMTPAPFQPGDVSAVVGDEGPGVMVLSQNLAIGTGANQGRCLTALGQGAITNDFASPRNDAYCLHNENYGATAAYWKPNARIDGLSLIGANNAPGVLVNGYAHSLEISNNKIYTNSGTYAGGIQLGHPGAAAPFSDDDAQNDHVAIHHNMVTQNASNETGGGGGVVLGTGSTSYSVANNFIAANLSAGNGGGISHVGLSQLGVIDANTVVFNESFMQGIGTNGGGLFIGGSPAAAGATTPGSGSVDVTNNLIQGNAASGGDGGGVALLGFTTSDRVRLYNNVIANNVAGLAGGGLSIDGLPNAGGTAVWVDVTHNTIVDNDSTGTAGAAFTAGPLTSVPQPAGIAGRGSMAHVRIANSIVWHNRTFYFGACNLSDPTLKCGIEPVAPNPGPTQYAEIQITDRPYWDIANLSGAQFSPIATVLSALNQPSSSANYLSGANNVSYNTNGNSATDMTARFVSWYFNANRRYAYQVGETTGEATLISVPAALDEGGNFIRPQFGPLSLTTANGASLFGDYHVTMGEGGRNLCGAGTTLFGNCGTNNANVPGALLFDIDHDPRPTVTPARGADQIAVAPVPAPTVTSITPNRGVLPLAGLGTATYAVTLTGTNLTGATVTEAAGGFSVTGVVVVNATTITATVGITSAATLGDKTLTVTTSSGSTTVTFTVTAPPFSFTSESGPATLTVTPPVTNTLAFGSQTGAVSDTVTITVGSTGPVTFQTASVLNGTGTAFSKGADTCSGTTKNPGETCTITVNFNGAGTLSRTGGLLVPYNGNGGISVALALSGS